MTGRDTDTRKTAKILIRVEPEWKARAEELARSRGLSLADLVRQAAEASLPELSKEGRQPEPQEDWHAKAVQRASRFRRGYAEVGYRMAQEAASRGKVSALRKALKEDNRKAVWDWFRTNFPEEMARVPSRTERRRSFLEGVWKAYAEGQLGG